MPVRINLPVSVLSAFHKSRTLRIPGLWRPAGTASAPPGPRRGSHPYRHGSSDVCPHSPEQRGETSRARGSAAGRDVANLHLRPPGTPVGRGTSGHSSWCRSCWKASCVHLLPLRRGSVVVVFISALRQIIHLPQTPPTQTRLDKCTHKKKKKITPTIRSSNFCQQNLDEPSSSQLRSDVATSVLQKWRNVASNLKWPPTPKPHLKRYWHIQRKEEVTHWPHTPELTLVWGVTPAVPQESEC